jgi:hypothetical protein
MSSEGNHWPVPITIRTFADTNMLRVSPVEIHKRPCAPPQKSKNDRSRTVRLSSRQMVSRSGHRSALQGSGEALEGSAHRLKVSFGTVIHT